MHQNVIAFHAANGMLNNDTDLTQDFLGSLLRIAQRRVGVLFALARLLGRDVNPLPAVVRLHTKGASIDPNMAICKPGQLRRTLLFQHEVIVMVTTKRPPQKDAQLGRERHDRAFQRRLVFFPTVMLSLFGIICGPMIGAFGGINVEAIHPLSRRLHIFRRRQLAIGHQCEMHQGIVQNR